MLKKIKESSEFLKKKISIKPKFGIILGTGLGKLANEISISEEFKYENIPHFPKSTVEGHSGKLIFGKICGVDIVAMQGRFHYYEGYSLDKITLPIRVMKMLGIEKLIVSNASGGVNPKFEIGDIMILTDHINLIPNPLIGENINELGVRFPDMSEPYCSEMINYVDDIVKTNNINYILYQSVIITCYKQYKSSFNKKALFVS